MNEKRWHRFRHYQGRWSTFDQIEECERPGKWCCGCEFKHPFCTENGAVLDQHDGLVGSPGLGETNND